MTLDITTVDNTSDGLVSFSFLAWETRYLYEVKCRKTQSAQDYLHASLNQSLFFFSKISSSGAMRQQTGTAD